MAYSIRYTPRPPPPPAATTLFHAFRPSVVFAAMTLGNPFTTSINHRRTLAAPILNATVTVATP